MIPFPLKGKSILNTRPRHQAEELTTALRQSGAAVIEFPVLEIVNLPLSAELRKVLDGLSAEDWLLFTSANGVASLCSQAGPALLQRAQTAAVGEATAAAARKAGLNVAFVAGTATAEAMAAELPPKLPAAARRIVLVQAREANEILFEKMRGTGKEVYRAAVYEAVIPQKTAEELEELRAALASGRLSAVLATSSNAVRNLLKFASQNEALLKKTPLFVIGPKTQHTARELGFSNVVLSPGAEAASLASAVVNHFAGLAPD